MLTSLLYSDKLVEISEDYIRFRLYFFPFGSKKVLFSDVESITPLANTLLTGKWRMWGTGNFLIWFPCDLQRYKRDKIFFLKRKDKRGMIGFTVEDSPKVIPIFKTKNVLTEPSTRIQP